MAQDMFINVRMNLNAAAIADLADHKNQAAFGSAAANDVTISWDHTKITSLSLLKSAVASAVLAAAGMLKG